MGADAIKLELIEWLAKFNDIDILNYLKTVKDSGTENQGCWNDLTTQQKLSIEKGLKDIDKNRMVSHSDVKKRYDL